MLYFPLKGSAKLIEFDPLKATDVTLPNEAVFVIAHSLTCHNKAQTSDFNQRVLECRLAAQVISCKTIETDQLQITQLHDRSS